MDGLLLIDKPVGPTSHDVVARLRRTSGERRIGHTGTLDPRASGLLPLVLGKATRLASFLTGSDKTYEAVIRLGQSTTTDDAAGERLGEPAANVPDGPAVEAALASFRGALQQIPPRHSAKRIAGERAYDIARRDEPVELAPVAVTVRELVCLGIEGECVTVRVVASSGFYVRALARDLGAQLGCGAHLSALRRTHVGRLDLTAARAFEEAERLGPGVAAWLIAPADALTQFPQVRANAAGETRVAHGNPIGPEHLTGAWLPSAGEASHVRVLAEDGRLLAIANPRGGALHPVVVLA